VAAFVQILVSPSPTNPPDALFLRLLFSLFAGVIKRITSCPDTASELVIGAPVEVVVLARNELLDSGASVSPPVEKGRSISELVFEGISEDSGIALRVDGDKEVDRFVNDGGNIPRWVDGKAGAVGYIVSMVAVPTGTR